VQDLGIIEKENLIYRALERDEIRKFAEIDRYEIIEDIYYFRDDKLVLEKEYYEVKEFDNIAERIKDLMDDYDAGKTIIGAFDEAKLVGLGSIGEKLIGKDKNVVNLETLHVSSKYRKKGIGNQLICILQEKAKQLGAEKLYVSATPSKNTVDFYRRVGFDLTAPIKELFDKEPEDIHMDMLL